jgi:hypothetical protein
MDSDGPDGVRYILDMSIRNFACFILHQTCYFFLKKAADELAHLQSLLHKHDLSAKVSIKLVQIYFPPSVRSTSFPTAQFPSSEQQSPQNAPPYFTGATISFKQHQARESIMNPGARHVPARVFRLQVLPCHHPARFINTNSSSRSNQASKKMAGLISSTQKIVSSSSSPAISYNSSPNSGNSFNTTTD